MAHRRRTTFQQLGTARAGVSRDSQHESGRFRYRRPCPTPELPLWSDPQPWFQWAITRATIDTTLAAIGQPTVMAPEAMSLPEFRDHIAALVGQARLERRITRDTAVTLLRDLRDLSGWSQLMGAANLADVIGLVPAWTASRDLSRKGNVKDAELATRHRRRDSAVWIFRQARIAGLTDTDPCAGIALPPRPCTPRQPLTDHQITRLDLAAAISQRTRGPAIYAAAVSGVPSSLVLDIDDTWLSSQLPLITRQNRTWEVLPQHWSLLQRQREAHSRAQLPGLAGGRILYSGAADRSSRQAQVGTSLSLLGDRAGVPNVTATRLNDWAARRVFESNGKRIDLAATLLGVDLDTAARRIGWDWK